VLVLTTERRRLDAFPEEHWRRIRTNRYLKSDVRVVTFHRPTKWLLGYSGNLDGRLHGYQPRFFADMGYCSDSKRRFRFQHPLNHLAFLGGRALQLVIHPIWWCAAAGETPLDKLRRYRREREEKLDKELAENCRPFARISSNL
jgi:hypothetical protein